MNSIFKSSLFFLASFFLSHFLQADRLVLVSASYGKNILAITEANGDVIWSHKTSGPEKGHAGHHDVHMLPNGNILFHETWQDVKEITLGKKIVMDYNCANSNGNQGKRVNVHAFQDWRMGILRLWRVAWAGSLMWIPRGH